MDKNDSSRATQIAAAALVSPLVLAPVITVGAMLWARHESILMHPAAAAKNPPTVSRAIADHHIGDPFAQWILAVCAMQAFAVYRIAGALYRVGIATAAGGHRIRMTALLSATVLCEAGAIAGLLVLSHYDSTNYSEIHQWGSYFLFFGNGFGILFSGVFIWLDHRHRNPRAAKASGPPVPYEFYLQSRLCAVASVIGIFFGILFYATVPLERWNDYGFRVTFAMCELVLLTACAIYLASFIAPMFRYERYLLMRRSRKSPAMGDPVES